jgi:hypothetical protein
MGFGPQLVDLDGDGCRDVVSGTWPLKVFVFRGTRDGGFGPGQPIDGSDGKPLEVGYGISVFAVDWDRDGRLDLLIGDTHAGVAWARNSGTCAFGKPQPLLADGTEVRCEGAAAPVAADWDADGDLDLLLGTEAGSVLWYRNDGSRTAPKLVAPSILILEPKKSGLRGGRAKFCVTDWNEDGRADIVLGDTGERFAKELDAGEQAWLEQSRREQAVLFEEWTGAFRAYRAALKESSGADAGARERLDGLRRKLEAVKHARERAFHEVEGLEPGQQRHGRLWLFLRLPKGTSESP